jgi:hypothetical protein
MNKSNAGVRQGAMSVRAPVIVNPLGPGIRAAKSDKQVLQ